MTGDASFPECPQAPSAMAVNLSTLGDVQKIFSGATRFRRSLRPHSNFFFLTRASPLSPTAAAKRLVEECTQPDETIVKVPVSGFRSTKPGCHEWQVRKEGRIVRTMQLFPCKGSSLMDVWEGKAPAKSPSTTPLPDRPVVMARYCVNSSGQPYEMKKSTDPCKALTEHR